MAEKMPAIGESSSGDEQPKKQTETEDEGTMADVEDENFADEWSPPQPRHPTRLLIVESALARAAVPTAEMRANRPTGMDTTSLLPATAPSSSSSSSIDESDQEEQEQLTQVFRRNYSSSTTERRKRAKAWPCRPCGLLLGGLQCVLGTGLIMYDVATNRWSNTAFAISAGMCFIVTGLLALIASRRIDRGTLLLCLLFSAVSVVMSVVLFMESAMEVNRLCANSFHHRHTHHHAMLDSEFLRMGLDAAEFARRRDSPVALCGNVKTSVHVALICTSLVEGVLALLCALVCARSLRSSYRIDTAFSPYSTLVMGPLPSPDPQRRPATIEQRKPDGTLRYTVVTPPVTTA